jgi:hypothetical protein
MNKIFTTFKNLLGQDRAFNLNEKNISNFSKSLLLPFVDLINTFKYLPFTLIPSQNPNINELDLKNIELQYNIKNNIQNLRERANYDESLINLRCRQSYSYLQEQLEKNDIHCKVIENIPETIIDEDVNIDYGDTNEYGNLIYGMVGYYILCNDIISYGNQNKDPVIINLNDIFLITGVDNNKFNITNSQLQILKDLVLKIKPAQKVAFINFNLI